MKLNIVRTPETFQVPLLSQHFSTHPRGNYYPGFFIVLNNFGTYVWTLKTYNNFAYFWTLYRQCYTLLSILEWELQTAASNIAIKIKD